MDKKDCQKKLRGLVTLSAAEELTGVTRKTIALWARKGRLTRVEHVMVRNLLATMVDPKEVAELAKQITRGRPTDRRKV